MGESPKIGASTSFANCSRSKFVRGRSTDAGQLAGFLPMIEEGKLGFDFFEEEGEERPSKDLLLLGTILSRFESIGTFEDKGGMVVLFVI